jgi:hypothetical protein
VGDSTADTLEHIGQVRNRLATVIAELVWRQRDHDSSKLAEPEKAMFDRFTPRLRNATYGSPQYERSRAAMGDALEHHYTHNRHHPEHFADGIGGMNLVDVIEMLADWKAATARVTDGDLDRSITQNAERFGYGPEFETLLRNTARDLGWL